MMGILQEPITLMGSWLRGIHLVLKLYLKQVRDVSHLSASTYIPEKIPKLIKI